ncbi:aminoglycoside 6'-N-acetyltransferase [uncultured Tateyamaria sp.]|uniref:aminoglycoside 6'-N-acetyltransferase n=1 Tax=uncultured Tateyamaria sp. TaxID=455651 RepID=UPI002636C454|nr:aminoglycoside 6'-N-acetyltransferase [uncultured Tateyamaria sp.]
MPIRIATSSDIEAWVALRAQLWADTPLDAHRAEAAAMLAKSPGAAIVFLDAVDKTHTRAFAEATLRHDHVNGCETSPVAFLEGIFVRPDLQGAGIGRALLQSVQSWAQDRDCSELASDAHLDNVASHAFHRALGFDETDRVVYFRKPIQGRNRRR